MTENIRKIFNMLGVEPNERFKIESEHENHIYYIDENLSLCLIGYDFGSVHTVLDILKKEIEIVKIPKYEFTKDEKNILKGLKLLKFNYIVRDEDERLTAYTDKPEKNYTLSIWQYEFGEITYVNPNMFNFIKWEDLEPFEIPNVEDELEYETDKEKIKDKLKSIFIMTDNKCKNTKCSECKCANVPFVDCSYYMALNLLIENGFTFLKDKENEHE